MSDSGQLTEDEVKILIECAKKYSDIYYSKCVYGIAADSVHVTRNEVIRLSSVYGLTIVDSTFEADSGEKYLQSKVVLDGVSFHSQDPIDVVVLKSLTNL